MLGVPHSVLEHLVENVVERLGDIRKVCRRVTGNTYFRGHAVLPLTQIPARRAVFIWTRIAICDSI